MRFFARLIGQALVVVLVVALAGLLVPTSDPADAKGHGHGHRHGHASHHHGRHRTHGPHGARTVRFENHGLDSCEAPTHRQMRDMYAGTKWNWWGVYIGGANRACSNDKLTKAWIRKETRRKWGLLPIWVGRQAPCFGADIVKIARDRGKAFRQGVGSGIGTVHRARALGLTPRSPVVLDMEGYDTGKPGCVRAVRSFVAGWVLAVRDHSRMSPGIYGSSCASGLSDIWTLPRRRRPGFVWAATWNKDPDVGNVSCLGSGQWPHRRHKQFIGDTKRSANGTTLSVDVNCAYGPVYARGRARRSSECT